MKKKIKALFYKLKAYFTSDAIDTMNALRYEQRSIYLLDKLLNSSKKGISSEKYCEHDIIVSLTSYGKRIFDVGLTIESIMQQTMLPNKIILNLESSLLSQPLPVTLQKLINRGLEINEVEDIRSYKKLIPTLKKYPDAIIITIDDDLLYDHDLVERLFQSYLKNPKSISAMRTHTIAFNKSGYPLNYSDWYYEQAVSDNPFHLFPTTGAGTLFPPGVFNKEVFNQEVFTTLCPTADDIWFHAMAVMNKTSIIKVVSRSNTGCDYLVNDSVQDMGLFHQNTGEKGRNDIQLKNVYSKYNIYSLLNSSNVD